MPISSANSIFKAGIESAYNLGMGGSPSVDATVITAALASGVPLGLKRVGKPYIPLAPAGFSACKSMIEDAFNLSMGGSPSTAALVIAQAISMLAPLAPPIGLSMLKSQLESIFNLGMGGNPSIIATQMAQAIVMYYKIGAIK